MEEKQPQTEQPQAAKPEAKPQAKTAKRAPRAKKAKPSAEKKLRARALRRILAGILTLLLVILALLVFVFRDSLTGEALRRSFGKAEQAEAAETGFAYETGSNQVFAPAGNGLAVASSSALALLDAEGETVFKQVVSYAEPAAFGCDKGALFCEIGGRGCVRAGFDGESISLLPNGDVLSANMNANGWFLLVTEEAGYKGLVTVYDSAGTPQFQWWSGAGYVLKAAVSPDNKSLAVLTADMEGSHLRFFSLRSETELRTEDFPNTLLFDFYYMGDKLCALSEETVWFLSEKAGLEAQYDFGGDYLMDYSFGSESFAAFFVSAYRTGGSGTLLSLDRSGNLLGTAPVERELSSMASCGKQLLVMTNGDLSLYGQDLTLQSTAEELMTAKRALLRPDGTVLLVSAYAAEEFKF